MVILGVVQFDVSSVLKSATISFEYLGLIANYFSNF